MGPHVVLKRNLIPWKTMASVSPAALRLGVPCSSQGCLIGGGGVSQPPLFPCIAGENGRAPVDYNVAMTNGCDAQTSRVFGRLKIERSGHNEPVDCNSRFFGVI